MAQHFDAVFCVLTYKNEKDLVDFANSIKQACNFTYKVVVVNSFFNEETKSTIEKTASSFNFDFINVDNKGYGAGNNRGIDYIRDNYDFDYLIVSNPDIVVKSFDIEVLKVIKDDFFLAGPKIICRKRKNQNPAVVKNCELANLFIYWGYKSDIKFLTYIGYAINKFVKLFSFYYFKKLPTIFQAHGSFVIFPKNTLEKLYPVYDENIFMFSEEMDLGYRTKELNIKSYYLKQIKVFHKEDGSIKLSNLNVYTHSKRSFSYVLKKWRKNKKA